MRRLVLVLAMCAALTIAGFAVSASTVAAEPAVGIIQGTKILVRFDTAKPGTFTGAEEVTGLGVGERLEDLDYRYHPNGELNPLPPPQLFALAIKPNLAYEAHLYTIDLATGAATSVGPPVQVPGGNLYGIDFNSGSDRIRGITDVDGNFRLNPSNGARADAFDSALNPAGEKITGLAYDQADLSIPPPAATGTTAYGIGTASSNLYTIGGIHSTPSPNLGQVQNPKPLGVTLVPQSPAGFDIDRAGDAFASLVVANEPGFYRVNLSSGAVTLVGKLPETLSGLAIVPETAPAQPPDIAAPTIGLKGVRGSMSLAAFLGGVKAKVTLSEAAKLDGALLVAAKSAQLASFNLTLATKSLKLASGARTLKLKPRRRLLGHPRKAFKVRLQVTATDAAGNAKVLTKTIKVKPPKG